MLVCVMHISNEKADPRVLLRRLAHICELPPGEARMLVDDDMISEDIDLTDSDDGFADVKRIELPVPYARHDVLIQELTRVEHASELNTLKVLSKGVRPPRIGSLAGSDGRQRGPAIMASTGCRVIAPEPRRNPDDSNATASLRRWGLPKALLEF